MKIIHATMLIPVLLGYCSLPHIRPADSDAQEFLDHLQEKTMADICDRAAQEMEFLDAIMTRPINNCPAASTLYCEDCNIPIPEARRIAIPGTRRCCDCQQLEDDRSHSCARLLSKSDIPLQGPRR